MFLCEFMCVYINIYKICPVIVYDTCKFSEILEKKFVFVSYIYMYISMNIYDIFNEF